MDDSMSLILSGDDGASKVNIEAFNSEGAAPQYVCRAWCFFDGTGAVTIKESGNISSLTDNAIGNYTINFETDMPDANYSISGGGGPTNVGVLVSEEATGATRTVSVLKILVAHPTSLNDYENISLQIFR